MMISVMGAVVFPFLFLLLLTCLWNMKSWGSMATDSRYIENAQVVSAKKWELRPGWKMTARMKQGAAKYTRAPNSFGTWRFPKTSDFSS